MTSLNEEKNSLATTKTKYADFFLTIKCYFLFKKKDCQINSFKNINITPGITDTQRW